MNMAVNSVTVFSPVAATGQRYMCCQQIFRLDLDKWLKTNKLAAAI